MQNEKLGKAIFFGNLLNCNLKYTEVFSITVAIIANLSLASQCYTTEAMGMRMGCL